MFRPIFRCFFILALTGMVSCVHHDRPAESVASPIAPPGLPFERHDTQRPFLKTHLYYGDGGSVKSMIEAQDDYVGRFRGLHRVGDGILSVGIKRGPGRWLRTHECGGHLFIEAQPGEACQIVLRNETRNRLEVVVAMDGRDVLSGAQETIHQNGVILAPGEVRVLGGGKADKLTFGAGRPDPSRPVIQPWMRSASGSISLSIFHEKGRLPWEGNHRTRRPPTMDKFPARQYEPEARNYEYR